MATENVLATQITLGTIGAGVLAYLKTAKWAPWFNKHSAKINHAWLLTTSAMGAIGVHYTWDATAHSLTITGLNAVAIAVALWVWAKQWCLQYVVQRGVFGPVAIPGDAPAPAATPVSAVDLKPEKEKP
jgi:hypothetical protein